jgi:hypothetical protein
MKKEAFGNWFREACRAAGVTGSAHGLRKAGATRAANKGASERQLEAIFGWRGGKMAAHYTRKADRARLAREAMPLLGGNPSRTSISSPHGQVRASWRKDKANQLLMKLMVPRRSLCGTVLDPLTC